MTNANCIRVLSVEGSEGARGYVLKSMPPPQILDTIRRVHAGKKCIPPEIAAGLVEHLSDEALSQREVEVLQQVAAGHRNRDIAGRLFIAEDSVKVHVKHIMGKLGANHRTQSVAIALRRGASFNCRAGFSLGLPTLAHIFTPTAKVGLVFTDSPAAQSTLRSETVG